MTHLAFLVLFGLVGENNDLFALAVFKHLSAYRSTVNICLLYTFRAHETREELVCLLLLEKKEKDG